MSKAINPQEVEKHKDDKSAWIIVEDGVYDVTDFLSEHPGGKKILLKACGGDATEQFWKFHNKRVLEKTAASMKIGQVGGEAKL